MALDTALSTFVSHAFARSRRVTFDDAVRDHQDELYGVALRILGDRDSAMDATSRALLKAFRSWSSYDQTRPIRHWLLRIVSNEAISQLREKGHTITRTRRSGTFGGYQGILIDWEHGVLHGATESRKDGVAAGY